MERACHKIMLFILDIAGMNELIFFKPLDLHISINDILLHAI